VVDGGRLITQARYKQFDILGLRVKIRPDNGYVLSVVFALKDFVSGLV
jgi:hypothetical protein